MLLRLRRSLHCFSPSLRWFPTLAELGMDRSLIPPHEVAAQVAERIRRCPDSYRPNHWCFDMGASATATLPLHTDPSEWECGTTASVVGHAVAVAYPDAEFDGLRQSFRFKTRERGVVRVMNPYFLASEALAISKTSACFLFWPDNSCYGEDTPEFELRALGRIAAGRHPFRD